MQSLIMIWIENQLFWKEFNMPFWFMQFKFRLPLPIFQHSIVWKCCRFQFEHMFGGCLFNVMITFFSHFFFSVSFDIICLGIFFSFVIKKKINPYFSNMFGTMDKKRLTFSHATGSFPYKEHSSKGFWDVQKANFNWNTAFTFIVHSMQFSSYPAAYCRTRFFFFFSENVKRNGYTSWLVALNCTAKTKNNSICFVSSALGTNWNALNDNFNSTTLHATQCVHSCTKNLVQLFERFMCWGVQQRSEFN